MKRTLLEMMGSSIASYDIGGRMYQVIEMPGADGIEYAVMDDAGKNVGDSYLVSPPTEEEVHDMVEEWEHGVPREVWESDTVTMGFHGIGFGQRRDPSYFGGFGTLMETVIPVGEEESILRQFISETLKPKV